VGSQTYLCKIPYSAFLDMLKNKPIGRGRASQDTTEILQKVSKVLEQQQHFAG